MQRQTLDKSYRQSLIEYNAPPDFTYFTYCGVKKYLLNFRRLILELLSRRHRSLGNKSAVNTR